MAATGLEGEGVCVMPYSIGASLLARMLSDNGTQATLSLTCFGGCKTCPAGGG